jgi:hypothetical protein
MTADFNLALSFAQDLCQDLLTRLLVMIVAVGLLLFLHYGLWFIHQLHRRQSKINFNQWFKGIPFDLELTVTLGSGWIFIWQTFINLILVLVINAGWFYRPDFPGATFSFNYLWGLAQILFNLLSVITSISFLAATFALTGRGISDWWRHWQQEQAQAIGQARRDQALQAQQKYLDGINVPEQTVVGAETDTTA